MSTTRTVAQPQSSGNTISRQDSPKASPIIAYQVSDDEIRWLRIETAYYLRRFVHVLSRLTLALFRRAGRAGAR